MKAKKKQRTTGRSSIATLQAELRALRRRVQELEDVEAIKKLQRTYGYYVDKAQWARVVDLFTADCEIEIAGRGVYVGTTGARSVFYEIGRMIGQPPEPRAWATASCTTTYSCRAWCMSRATGARQRGAGVR